MAVPHMISEMGYSRNDIGWMLSYGAIIYGVGKGICGFLSERFSARIFMSLGLMLASITSFFIGLSGNLWSLFILVCLSNCFQSMGAAPCIRLLANWFSAKELATKWSIWNMSQQIGGGLTVVLSGFLVMHFGWRYIFFVPGIISFFGSIFIWERLRDDPEELGFPSAEQYHGLKDVEKVNSSTWNLLKMMFKNPLVWCMGLANFFVYFVRMSFFNWGPTLLYEAKGNSLQMAGWQTAFFDIGGIVGGVLAGYLSDRVFKGYRGRVGTIYMGLLSFGVLLLWKSPNDLTYLHFLGMGLIGFLVSGPQILVGVAAADFSSKRAAAAANGFTGIVGYIGTAATGSGISHLVKDGGDWDKAFAVIMASAILSAICFSFTWNKRSSTLERS
jgi:OPA family glycerol-3-phosphate transporter-like MFS transporter